jgi:bidirectional [NiFe] hydrogenase diaphorase subunit
MSSFVFNRASQMPDVVRTDPRVKRVIAAMNQFGRRPDSLIQILHAAQGMYGYLPLPIIRFIAQEIKVAPSRVYGVVTFYHFFSLKPKGEHSCLVCTGTACYVKGAQKLIDEVEKVFDVKAGDTTKDNKLSLQTARCIGACGLAPAVTYDEEILAKQNPGDLVRNLKAKLGVSA